METLLRLYFYMEAVTSFFMQQGGVKIQKACVTMSVQSLFALNTECITVCAGQCRETKMEE